ncbi:MAG: MATE family efflux transporter [Clostridiales bacterium]|nr:MATE family efflux transporter [Clostridiales bacterium]
METLFNDGVTPKKFYKFVWPSVLMMIVIALYYGIDSILVSNLAGETALAALSIAYPVQGLMWGVSVMFAAGSSAIVAINMGEGDQDKANERFSLVCVLSILMGIAFTAANFIFMDQIIDFLGATDALKQNCYDFLNIFAWSYPAAFVGLIFEYYIRIEGDPGFTLFLYLFNGFVHLAVAYICIGPMDMGISGAAYGNLAGLVVMAVIGWLYFIIKKTKLKFRRFRYHAGFVGHCFVNGSSELVTEASAGITTFFFNIVVIDLAGEVGVAAVSIVLNVHYLFISLHLGFIMGVAPLLSYYYGAKDYDKVNIFIRYSRNFILVASVAGAVLCLAFANVIVMAFESPGTELYDIALEGTRLLSIALLMCGFNVYASGFFTAYGNGIISALISTSRALVMVIAGMYLLAWLFGITGVWLTLTFAEVTTMGLTFGMLIKYKSVYNYKL